MKTKLLSIFLLVSLINTSLGHLKCGKMPKTEIKTVDFGNGNSEDTSSSDVNERKLSSSPIRFTYDDTLLKTSQNQQYLVSIQNALETAFNFYKSFMKVKIPTPVSYQIETCYNYRFQSSDKNSIISNSDMHFIVNVLYDQENWIARAGACLVQKLDNRPLTGIVEFNSKYLPAAGQTMSNYDFKNLVSVTVHELFHALVFSSDLFESYKGIDSSMYNIVEGTIPWVAFPTVLKFAKEHFGCDTITQIQLEDDGGNGSAGSHWERSTFSNDIMTASLVDGDNTWSGINNALMQDSGWYDVNLDFHNGFFWGKKKGCDFFNKQCEMNPLPEEFCLVGQSQDNNHGFNYSGFSFCTNQDIFQDKNCGYFVTPEQQMCQDPKNNNSQDSEVQIMIQNGSVFGWNSKGVTSSLSPKSNNVILDDSASMCYPQKCIMNGNAQNIEFYIGASKTKVVCGSDNQIIQLDDYNGRLLCPKISDFCERQYSCENECNKGGFCQNQKCYCTPGFSGPSCQCGNGQFYKDNSCSKCSSDKCISCKENDECVKCALGYVLDSNKKCSQEGEEDDQTFSSILMIKILFFMGLLILF